MATMRIEIRFRKKSLTTTTNPKQNISHLQTNHSVAPFAKNHILPAGRSKPLLKVSCTATTNRSSSTDESQKKKTVIVVGGGWAGFAAVKHLSEQGYDVTLLDAADNPGGLSAGWRTPKGRTVEAGTKGFWWQYHNIFKLLDDLEIRDCLTPFLNSGFWGKDGLITEAPVFSDLPRLPAILGQFFYTNPLMYQLPLADRLTIVPWLYSAIDLDSTPENYQRYDEMSAREMWARFGVTEKAYELFLKPTLQVGLFSSPEELSAAVTLETLYFYALAHQNDFDVCWCKGSISERIFQPLIKHIENKGGKIRGGRFVTGLETNDSGEVTGVVAKAKDGSEELYSADAVVFAISISGMQKLVLSNPELAKRQEFRNVMKLRSIDCIATRLWFDRRIPTRFPVNVIGQAFEDVGSTYFNLTDLHDEYKNEPETVIAADFYGASSLLPLSDEEIIELVHNNISKCEPAFADAKVVDSVVLRYPRAVTHFSPGSYKYRPTQMTSFGNVMLAGDWVKGVNHGANGLSQERAWVTGLSAANLVVQQLGQGDMATIIPVEPDEAHIKVAKDVNRQFKTALEGLGIRSLFL